MDKGREKKFLDNAVNLHETEKLKAKKLVEKYQEIKKLTRSHKKKEILKVIDEILDEYPLTDPHDIIKELAKIRNQINKNQKVKYFRITVFIIFSITALTIGLLQFTPVFWGLEITGKIKTDLIEFKLAKAWTTKQMSISNIRLSKLDTLILQNVRIINPDAGLDSTRTFSRIVLRPESEFWGVSFEGKKMQIQKLYFDSKALILLEQIRNQPGEYRWKIQNGKISGSIFTGKNFSVSCNNCNIKNSKSKVSKMDLRTNSPLINISSMSNTLILNFNTNNIFEAKPFELIEQEYLDIVEINFTKLVGASLVSSIKENCEIYFPQLDMYKITIKSQDFLKLHSVRNFKITKLSLLENEIEIHIQGEVHNIQSGLPGFFYSRFPSLLEYLQKNHKSILYFGTLLPVLGTLIAFLYRLKIFDEA